MYPREKSPFEKEFNTLLDDFVKAMGTPQSNKIQDVIAQKLEDPASDRLPSDMKRFAQLIMGEM